MLADYPKLECPFVRKRYRVSKESWKKYGHKLQLRTPEVYLATPEINPEYEWIFNCMDTVATEKLDGTNVSIKTENGRLVYVQNRKNILDPLQVIKGPSFIIEGIFRAISKGYIKQDEINYGEVVGPKLQGNPYKLDNHIWVPFDYILEHYAYSSFIKQERTFNNFSSWFQHGLRSRFYMKKHKCAFADSVFAEGIVFYNMYRKVNNLSWRCKLRRDMFEWYYTPYLEIGEEIKDEDRHESNSE